MQNNIHSYSNSRRNKCPKKIEEVYNVFSNSFLHASITNPNSQAILHPSTLLFFEAICQPFLLTTYK